MESFNKNTFSLILRECRGLGGGGAVENDSDQKAKLISLSYLLEYLFYSIHGSENVEDLLKLTFIHVLPFPPDTSLMTFY